MSEPFYSGEWANEPDEFRYDPDIPDDDFFVEDETAEERDNAWAHGTPVIVITDNALYERLTEDDFALDQAEAAGIDRDAAREALTDEGLYGDYPNEG